MSLFICLLLTDIKTSLPSHHLPLTLYLILLGCRMAVAISQFWLCISETYTQFPWNQAVGGLLGYVHLSPVWSTTELLNTHLLTSPDGSLQAFTRTKILLPVWIVFYRNGSCYLKDISFPRTCKDLKQIKLFHSTSSKVFLPSSGSQHHIVLQV